MAELGKDLSQSKMEETGQSVEKHDKCEGGTERAEKLHPYQEAVGNGKIPDHSHRMLQAAQRDFVAPFLYPYPGGAGHGRIPDHTRYMLQAPQRELGGPTLNPYLEGEGHGTPTEATLRILQRRKFGSEDLGGE